MLHVLFAKDGTPVWVGPEPRDGSEPIEDLTVDYLAGHRRTSRGNWVQRPVPVVAEPSPEEVAARREAEFKAALAARDEALRAALMVEADPLFFQWQRGEVVQQDWLDAVAAVKGRFPKPDRL